MSKKILNASENGLLVLLWEWTSSTKILVLQTVYACYVAS